MQIFDKFSATNNRACTPICVKLSDIDIFDLLIFLYVFFILQLFEISCSRCNCECMPICVKLSDIDILGSIALAFHLLNWPPYSYLS